VEGKNYGSSYKNIGLWVIPVSGSKPARNLTAKYDLHTAPDIINDCGSTEWMQPTWSNDGQTLYFQAALHGSAVLKSITVDIEYLCDVVGEGGAVGAFTFDRAQTKVAYFYGQMADPGQVYLRELANGGRTWHLTRVHRDLLDSLNLSRVEEVLFKGPAWNELQGWIMFPPGFDQKKKHPSRISRSGGNYPPSPTFAVPKRQRWSSTTREIYAVPSNRANRSSCRSNIWTWRPSL
jgi:dipeptidyl aminopeptidase/acylaminoacyl peptidase